MEAYPPQYVEHNLPLVLLSGLGEHEDIDPLSVPHKRQDSGAKITTESPECQNEKSEQVLREFMSFDGRAQAWNSTSLPGPTGTIRYRMKTIGRSYTLPARKAAPSPQSPGVEGLPTLRNTELHSPLSPLSPGSGIFPDGLYTPLWFSKHQNQVPALFLAFFDLSAGEGASQDEQLKADIGAIRAALARSGFKTRFAAILMSDQSILHAPELEDRLASIRRATSLDPKSGLFFMPPMSSQAEISTFIQTIVGTLQPSCIEYYRDLTKHARRKKTRGGPPPQVNTIGGATHTTSSSTWNVRYEVKQGVFAEFRQEMDVAERHYSAAMEELFSSEGGLFETTASWDPRWDEARLLCDSLAIRLLRCQLWHAQTTSAAQSWQNYKLRMRDLIDRRGKGSNTYGWDAWEARWASIMSQLISMADVPSLQRSVKEASGDYSAQQIYSMPERPTDRLLPFNFLHHSGYWVRLFANGIRSRWEKALAIPEEDRVPPGQSPASSVANRSKNYDVYLVPEPHEEGSYDHAAELGSACIRAAEEFEARRQLRLGEQMRLELAEDLIRVGRHADALRVLIQIWEQSTWREDEWNVPFARLLRLLHECTAQDKTKQNATIMLSLTWEMLRVAPYKDSGSVPNLAQCLESWDVGERLDLRVYDKQRLSPIRPSFAFKDRETNVGEPFECQIVLEYETPEASAVAIDVSTLQFKIGQKPIFLRHETAGDSGNSSDILSNLAQPRELDDGTLEFNADLRVRPSQRKILSIPLIMREAQSCSVQEMSLSVETETFSLTHCFEDGAIQESRYWHAEKNGDIRSALLQHFDTRSIIVLPKPPKMQVQVHGLRKNYYTDEVVHLVVELSNTETEAVNGTAVPQIIGPEGETMEFKWANSQSSEKVWSISDMKASATDKGELTIQAPSEAASYTLELKLEYTLASDTSTPLSKTFSVEMAFVMPFEAKFTFGPQLHADSWPSFFEPKTSPSEKADGILQTWKVGSQLTSLINKPLEITKLELVEHQTQGEVICTIRDSIVSEQNRLSPNGMTLTPFELTTQKHSLDDRRPSYLDLSLIVTWSKVDAGPTEEATTTIAVPRLTIPTSEPRVLCIRSHSSRNDSITLEYHMENPSAHFLTFAVTMEASEEFAFSGPKYRTLSLGPLSRHCISYQLMIPDEKLEWITPNLQVMDSYYQKSLRVHPGGKGVKMNDHRELAVWVGEGDPPA